MHVIITGTSEASVLLSTALRLRALEALIRLAMTRTYMPKPLPSKLGKEPIVEAVCELRVSPTGDLHTVLPGYLYASFRREVGPSEQLPASMIPEAMRAQDTNLAYASIVRIPWRNYFVLIGARNVAIGCRLPYPGWAQFRLDIHELFRTVIRSGLIRGVDRYSVKFINFFPSSDGEQGNTAMLDWTIRFGEFVLDKEHVQLRVEMPNTKDTLTIMTISSPAQYQPQGEPARSGGVIDVDTVCTHVTNDLATFDAELEGRLDGIRLANKRAFFDCLTLESINQMEPQYEPSAVRQ